MFFKTQIQTSFKNYIRIKQLSQPNLYISYKEKSYMHAYAT